MRALDTTGVLGHCLEQIVARVVGAGRSPVLSYRNTGPFPPGQGSATCRSSDNSQCMFRCETSANTQQVERMWGSAKWRNKRQRGPARQHFDSYLAEYIWRSSVAAEGGDPFCSLCADIAAFWVAECDQE
ncbi:hypothetical protein J6590_081542 [Homalodisca vitripennis]|nr:hypothetical protein J6590_081542 [Homalodisca vitripennis]